MPQFAAVGVALAGTALQVQASRSQAKQQKAIGEQNAELFRRDADAKRTAGKLETDRRKDRLRRLLSSQTAGFGKAGVRLTGSPLIVQLDTAERETFDALIAGFNVETGVQTSLAQADIEEFKGGIARTTGQLRTGQALLSGASTIFT